MRAWMRRRTRLSRSMPWCCCHGKSFERVWRKPDVDRKSRAGRKPMDVVLMFKAPALSSLYNLSDDQVEGGFLGWASGIGCPTPRRCGCIAKRWHRRVR